MSAGIIIPHDRTTRQPIFAYCRNPDCSDDGKNEFRFTVEDDLFCCPKCGANEPPLVGAYTLIHWLVRDQKGPILGSGGLRYFVACDPNRHHLATFTNLEAASGDPSCINCPQCLLEAANRKNQIQGKVYKGSKGN